MDTSCICIEWLGLTGTTCHYQYEIADRHPALGSALTIQLAQPIAEGTKIKVKVDYSTTDKCTAVQYLEPE